MRPPSLLLLFLLTSAWTEAARGESIETRLSASKKVYLVGEPIELRFRLTNGSKRAVQSRMILKDTELSLIVEGGPKGGPRRRLNDPLSVSDQIGGGGGKIPLAAGKSWCFQHSVGYSDEDEKTFLVFPKPGRYEIFVRFPFGVEDVESPAWVTPAETSVEVEIREPRDKDAAVWRTLWHREVLLAWTEGFDPPAERTDDALAVRIAEQALRMNPEGGYAPSLRRMLRRYYDAFPHKLAALSAAARDDTKKLIRWTPPPEPREPFPDDRRLDQQVKLGSSDYIPLREVMSDVSHQAKLTLKLSEAVDRRGIREWSVPRTESLRQFMRSWTSSQGYEWRADGTGYVLMSVPKVERSLFESLYPDYGKCDDPQEAAPPAQPPKR